MMAPIRAATKFDAEQIRAVHQAAFPEGGSERIARLAVDLLLEKSTPPILSLVAEADREIVGHVAFSPVILDGDDVFPGSILAPLAVNPEHQKHGIGSQLIREGTRRLSEKDAAILFVYGDPDYYGRFGFRADIAKPFLPPYELSYPFGWQGILLAGRQPACTSATIRCVPSLCDPALW